MLLKPRELQEQYQLCQTHCWQRQFWGRSGLNEDVNNTLFSHFHLDYRDALSCAVIQVDRERRDLDTFGDV